MEPKWIAFKSIVDPYIFYTHHVVSLSGVCGSPFCGAYLSRRADSGSRPAFAGYQMHAEIRFRIHNIYMYLPSIYPVWLPFPFHEHD